MNIVLKNNHTWVLKEIHSKSHELWYSDYYSSDGDGVDLYIQKDKEGFELHCFSGIPASSIFIDKIDFGVFQFSPNKIDDLDFTEPFSLTCIKIADYICSKFCDYIP